MEIKFEKNNVTTDGPCVVCEDPFTWEEVMAVAYDSQERLGDVCPTCLNAGPLGIRDRLMERAERLRHFAEEIEAVAHDLIIMPSSDDYAQRTQWLEEWQAGQGRIDDTSLPVDADMPSPDDPAWEPVGSGTTILRCSHNHEVPLSALHCPQCGDDMTLPF